jgi:hypothetical protein
VCTHEQGAEKMFMLDNTFPLITMPIDVDPWSSESSVRTRQLVFHALVQEIEHVHLILSQQQIETYWETGQYGTLTFQREWVIRHVQAFQNLLLEFPEKITITVIPSRKRFPINIEIINGEYISLQKAETVNEKGGLILHDRELADTLQAYIDLNISSGCQTKLEGAQNVAKWLEKQFGVKASGM